MPSVTVVCSDPRNHIWPYLEQWCFDDCHKLVTGKSEAKGGDLLLLVSCTEVIEAEIREKYRRTLVIHESDLPRGRGWSPMAWQILDGLNEVVISLIEAGERVDTGPILRQETVEFEGHELSDELNTVRDMARLRLARWAVENFETAPQFHQSGEPTYYARRRPEDSRIDPEQSIAGQFNLLRICEPRFPAFFELRGHRYHIELRKVA
jgi:methionyl-tRNA formyltransferase